MELTNEQWAVLRPLKLVYRLVGKAMPCEAVGAFGELASKERSQVWHKYKYRSFFGSAF